ncbi:4Fe-4S cluster-binding domain-containing protein, partial [bacterium]|nr:4Fe-4S cluster-binding domain-containing protein [bacterium]
MDFRVLSTMPWIHLFASPACNLNCEYCTQGTIRTNKVSEDFLENHALLELISQIPPTSFYISGGEPLIHPG